MPPPIPFASMRLLESGRSRPRFCCTQCLTHRATARINLRNRITTLRNIRTGRFASTYQSPGSHTNGFPMVTPATAINKPLDVSSSNKELYKALERLKTEAANYVGISRLGLALRSLEDRDGIVRIAVLAMDGDVRRVKRLVRLLLADPLGKQDAWEAELAEGGNGESLLIRYGDEGDVVQSSSQVRTLTIPSRVLQKHNLEILVSSLQLETAPSEFGPASTAHDAILVPGFNAQSTSSGRYSHMTYPVHKTLLVGNGISSLVDYGKFTASFGSLEVPAELVQLAVEAPAQSSTQTAENDNDSTVLLDVDAGEHALASIRQSINNALTWEHGWFKAGIPPLSTWLFSGIESEDEKHLKPIVRQLISTVLEDTETAISASKSAAELEARVLTVPDSVRRNLLKATAAWSEKAHEELRTQLDLAFASKNWARLKWYKLFWRSDDVTMLLSEIMERRWLPEAEKGSIYLAGRIEGAGLVSADVEGNLLNTRPSPPSSDIAIADTADKAVDISAYPMNIPQTRAALATRTIPSLQALSQTLVLQTGTGTAITTAVTAMAYLGFSNATFFEAGAVLAFGVVLSMKRLQNKWESAREFWQGEVREHGRIALKETEGGIKEIVETGGVGMIDSVGVEDRRRAVEAVQAVKDALARTK